MRLICGFPFLLLVGCTTDVAPQLLPSARAALPQDMVLTVSSVYPGGVIDLTVTGVPAGADLRLAWASDAEITPGPCPALLGGECLDIDGGVLRVRNLPDAGPGGEVSVSFTAPAAVAPGTVFAFQAVALDGPLAVGSQPVLREAGDACSAWIPDALADLDGDGDAELTYRVPVTFFAPSVDLEAPPLTATVDFRSMLDGFGDFTNVDVQAIRVYRPACDGQHIEVRSQYVDALVDLHRKAEHDSPYGDSVGTVALLHETDGLLATREVLPAGSEATYYVYFGSRGVTGGQAPAPNYPTDIVTGQTTLQNSELGAYFDPSRGGLLADLYVPGSPTLVSQADSCCGNAMAFWQSPDGWVDPQDGASRRLRLLAPGPILAAVKAEGSRTADDGTTLWGAYDYESTYWTFSQTPALYYATWQQATTESVNNHLDDAADGFRPWESYQLALHAAPHSFDAGDETAPWIEMTSDDWGVWIGMVHAAEYVTALASPIVAPNGNPLEQYLAFYANDLFPYGGGTPQTIGDGEVWFDNIAFAIVPFADETGSPADAVRPAITDGLLEGVWPQVGVAEAAP